MNLNAQIPFFDRVKFVDKLLFTKHLAVMIKSGVPLGESIDTISQQTTNPAFKRMLLGILEQVNNGQTLKVALSKYPKVFDAFYLNLIHIGEESGTLEKNLEYLVEQLKKSYDFDRKVKGALLYPEIVLGITFISGGSIALFVLPKLVELFDSLAVDLPLSTKILLYTATLMKTQGHWIAAGVIISFILFKMFISIPTVKFYWHQFILSMPIIGTFLQQVEVGYFCRNTGVMLKSGLPLTTALTAQADATTNLVFKKYVIQIEQAVEKGKGIAQMLEQKRFRFMPLLVMKMIGIGEKTGRLDESLAYLGDFYADEVDNNAKNFSAILEPVVLIFIGLIVAFVAFAIITPIYQLTGSIHG